MQWFLMRIKHSLKYSLVALPTFLLLGLMACILDYDKEEGNDFIFPLNVSNVWHYQRSFQRFYYTVDNTTRVCTDTVTLTSEVTVAITENAVLDEQADLARMVTTEKYGNTFGETVHLYRNELDGLYLYAYLIGGGPTVMPKMNPQKQILCKGRRFSGYAELSAYLQEGLPLLSLLDDSLMREEPPKKILHYPLKVRKRWTYRATGQPFRIDKFIAKRSVLAVGCGQFDCLSIKFIYDLNNDGRWENDIWITDYISREGLVKREITVLNLTETDINNPAGTGRKVDAFDTFTLTDYSINAPR